MSATNGPAVQSRNGKPFKAVLVRMPADQLDQLRAFAKAQYRTLTGEINRRLEASLVGESIDEHGVIVVQDAARNK